MLMMLGFYGILFEIMNPGAIFPGVVGAIVPWNFPMMIGMWKIAPALACGCTVVLKPAELTPLTALKLGELALEAGIPAGVLNVVPGFGAVAGQALVDHPDVDKVTFTGSPGVGRQILQGSAGNLKRVTLELGGKSANVIFPDADIETAAKAAASGIFFNSGQVCSAGSRIVVHNSIREQVVERLVARAEKIRTGDPSDGGTQMGPVVSEKQMGRILDYIRIGEEEGARLVTGGARAMERGYFVAPTVFDDVRPEMRISQEEIFGPVASVIGFDDEDEALAIANGTSFSLAAGIWTNDMRRMHRFLRDLKAGTVWANAIWHSGQFGSVARSNPLPLWEHGAGPTANSARSFSRPVPSGVPSSAIVFRRPNAADFFLAVVRVAWNAGRTSWNLL